MRKTSQFFYTGEKDTPEINSFQSSLITNTLAEKPQPENTFPVPPSDQIQSVTTFRDLKSPSDASQIQMTPQPDLATPATSLEAIKEETLLSQFVIPNDEPFRTTAVTASNLPPKEQPMGHEHDGISTPQAPPPAPIESSTPKIGAADAATIPNATLHPPGVKELKHNKPKEKKEKREKKDEASTMLVNI